MFKEYMKQNIIMAVLRKVNSVICRLIKKINNVKEDLKRKTNSNFNYFRAT